MKGWDLAALYEKSGKESVAMFDGLNNSAVLYLKGFEKDGKTIAGHKNYEKFYQELAQIDFLEKVFQTRFNLFDGKPEEKLAYALEGKAPNLLDELFGKNKEGK